MNKKIYLLLIGLLLATGCDKEKTNINEKPNISGDDNVIVENGNKENISEKLKEEKQFENYKVTDATLVTKDGITTFNCKVKNVLSTSNNGGLVDVIFIDKNGNEVSKLTTYIPSLEPGGQTYLEASIAKDMANAYDYYFKMK